MKALRVWPTKLCVCALASGLANNTDARLHMDWLRIMLRKGCFGAALAITFVVAVHARVVTRRMSD